METIKYHNQSHEILVRNNLVVAFFCQAPFFKFSKEVEKIFGNWVEWVPKEALTWALVGEHADAFKRVTKQTITRCKSLLDPEQVKKREITSFEISGPEKFGPAYAFKAIGSPTIDEEIANLVEMRFPTEFISQCGVEMMLDFIFKAASKLPYDSGYAAYALCWGVESEKDKAGEIIVPLALKHPGYDIDTNDWTRFNIGQKSRGARWLTLIGDSLLEKLGSRDKIKSYFTNGIEVAEAGSGLAFRAAKLPEIGDVNQKQNLPNLRAIADLIEPVTLFDDIGLDVLFNQDADKIDCWEKRFIL